MSHRKSRQKNRPKSVVIDVNDVLEELNEENKRLFDELLFANKCLKMFIQYKSFVDFISIKVKPNLESYESRKFSQLNENLNQLLTKRGINCKLEEQEIDSKDTSLTSDNETNYDFSDDLIKQEIEDIDEFVDDYYQSSDESIKDYYRSPEESEEEYYRSSEEFDPDFDCDDESLIDDNEWEDIKESKTKKNKTKKKMKGDILTERYGRPLKPGEPLNKNSCHECQIRFRRSKDLIRHNKNFHPSNPIPCVQSDCQFTTGSLEILNEHIVRTHSVREDTYQCCFNDCSQQFISEDILKKHYMDDHLKPKRKRIRIRKPKPKPLKTIRCTHIGCQFITSSEKALRRHALRHSTDRPYKCPVEGCRMSFKARRFLNKHVSIGRHSDDKSEFKCTWEGCGKVFTSSSYLVGHKKVIHLKKEEFSCDWPGCDYKAYNRQYVQRHCLGFHSEPKFKCDYPGCNVQFKLKQQMKKHKERVHFGIKDLCCPWPGCSYRAYASANMKRHELSHTKEKPFACEWPGCQFRSSQKGNVKTHMNQVHEKKVFLTN